MPTKIYLRVLDEDQAPLEMKAPWLVPRGAMNVLAEFRNEGNDVWSLELNPSIAGNVQLILRLADHPPIPFSFHAEDGSDAPFSFRKQIPRCASLTQQVVTRGQDQSTTIVALQFNLTREHEEIVLVTGVDLKGGTDYTRFSNTLRDDLYTGTTRFGGSQHAIPRAIHDHTVVTLFDFATGMRRRQIKAQESWHELDAVLLGAKPPYIEDGKSAEAEHRRHDEDTISIVHVYAYVAALGDDAPGSLAQMHFFSHAWRQGPVLLNTNEDIQYQSDDKGLRDPRDKDPRSKDFCEDNMPNFKGFCRAFAAKGFLKVWGCFRHNIHQEVDAVADLQDPEESVTIGDKEISYNSREIAEMVRREAVAPSYLGMLIKSAGIVGHGAVPTTTSNYQRVGWKYYMFVDRNAHGSHLGWFERNFDVKADEWGYVDFRALL